MRRCLIFALMLILGVGVAHAEILQGLFIEVIRQANGGTYPVPSLVFQAGDEQSQSTVYDIRICLYNAPQVDGFCAAGTTNSATITGSLTTGSPLTMATYGGINLADGSLHYFCAYAVSKAGDTEMNDLGLDFTNTGPGTLCTGVPVQYDLVNSNLLDTWTPNLSSATPATADQFALYVNTSDTNSVGSAGTTICAGGSTANGSTAILDDGFAGIWIASHFTSGQYPTECGHVYELTFSTTEAAAVSTFTAATNATLISSLSATSLQYGIAFWTTPSFLNGTNSQQYSMGAWLTMFPQTHGVEPTVTACTNRLTGLGYGPQNPNFNSGTNSTPLTTYNVRPTAMGAAGACTASCTTSTNITPPATWTASPSTFTAIVAAAKAAKGSNPTGNVAQNSFGNTTRAIFPLPFAPASAGNVISSKFSYNLNGTFSSPCGSTIATCTGSSNTGVIAQFISQQAWNYAATFSFVAGSGVISAGTSLPGQFSGGGQTPIVSGLWSGTGGVTGTNPAVFGIDTAVEPCESLPMKEVQPSLFLKYYAKGWSAIQAAAKSQIDPWAIQWWGEPLAQPFPASGSNPTATFAPSF